VGGAQNDPVPIIKQGPPFPVEQKKNAEDLPRGPFSGPSWRRLFFFSLPYYFYMGLSRQNDTKNTEFYRKIGIFMYGQVQTKMI
jgi:hypothetical protein